MQEFAIILMLKEAGVLEKELCVLSIPENGGLIESIFAEHEGNSVLTHMTVGCGRDLLDWEFSAVFDYYDTEIFGEGVTVRELGDGFNPAWELVFPYIEDEREMAERAASLLAAHKTELLSVFEAVKGLEGEYGSL